MGRGSYAQLEAEGGWWEGELLRKPGGVRLQRPRLPLHRCLSLGLPAPFASW